MLSSILKKRQDLPEFLAKIGKIGGNMLIAQLQIMSHVEREGEEQSCKCLCKKTSEMVRVKLLRCTGFLAEVEFVDTSIGTVFVVTGDWSQEIADKLSHSSKCKTLPWLMRVCSCVNEFWVVFIDPTLNTGVVTEHFKKAA